MPSSPARFAIGKAQPRERRRRFVSDSAGFERPENAPVARFQRERAGFSPPLYILPELVPRMREAHSGTRLFLFIHIC